MEFEEMKKIWDTQNNEVLYAINEQALHNRILSKKKSANHVTNVSELLLIIVNGFSGIFIFILGWTKPGGNVFLYLMASWMLLTMLYMTLSRIRRQREGKKFDRTLVGDLNHALATATYQVRISQLMRWNNLPILILLLSSIWENEKGVWVIAFVFFFFSLGYYLSGKELNVYKTRKNELELLSKKLDDT
jgi:hypothetical protein